MQCARRSALIAASVVAAGMVGFGLMVTMPAHASLNGQQIRACSDKGDYTTIRLQGVDNTGRPADVANALGVGCTMIPGHWWVGRVHLTASGSALGFADAVLDCDVPKVQRASDWFDCRLDAGSPPPPKAILRAR